MSATSDASQSPPPETRRFRAVLTVWIGIKKINALVREFGLGGDILGLSVPYRATFTFETGVLVDEKMINERMKLLKEAGDKDTSETEIHRWKIESLEVVEGNEKKPQEQGTNEAEI